MPLTKWRNSEYGRKTFFEFCTKAWGTYLFGLPSFHFVSILLFVCAGDLYTEAAEGATAAMKGRIASKYYVLADEAWAQVSDSWCATCRLNCVTGWFQTAHFGLQRTWCLAWVVSLLPVSSVVYVVDDVWLSGRVVVSIWYSIALQLFKACCYRTYWFSFCSGEWRCQDEIIIVLLFGHLWVVSVCVCHLLTVVLNIVPDCQCCQLLMSGRIVIHISGY